MKAALPAGVHVWSDGFTCKLDPSDVQRQRSVRHAGACRYVFNWMLARINANTALWQSQREAGVPVEDRVKPLDDREHYDIFKAVMPQWWAQARVSVWVYRKAIDDAVEAHTRFMNGLGRYPRWAPRSDGRERFSFQGSDVVLTEAGKVRLPKLGWVNIAGAPSRMAVLRRQLRRGRAKLMRVTVSRHADGSWWLSGSVEHRARTQPAHPAAGADVAGGDRGLSSAARCGGWG